MLIYLVTLVMALFGAGEVGVLAVTCHLAEVAYTLISIRALYEKFDCIK